MSLSLESKVDVTSVFNSVVFTSFCAVGRLLPAGRMLGITSKDKVAVSVSLFAPSPVYVIGLIVPVKPVVGVKVYVPSSLIVIEPAFGIAIPFSSTPATLLIVTPVFPAGTAVGVPFIVTEVTVATFSSLVNNAPSTGLSFGV